MSYMIKFLNLKAALSRKKIPKFQMIPFVTGFFKILLDLHLYD